jgi:hypothetical protein
MEKSNISQRMRAHKKNPKNHDAEHSKSSNLSDLLTKKNLREKAVKVLEEALLATKVHWDGVAKRMVEEPDHKVRKDAAVDLLCFTDGKPIERREVVTLNFDSLEELQRRVQQSPALKAAVKKILEPMPEVIQIDGPHENQGENAQ